MEEVEEEEDKKNKEIYGDISVETIEVKEVPAYIITNMVISKVHIYN